MSCNDNGDADNSGVDEVVENNANIIHVERRVSSLPERRPASTVRNDMTGFHSPMSVRSDQLSPYYRAIANGNEFSEAPPDLGCCALDVVSAIKNGQFSIDEVIMIKNVLKENYANRNSKTSIRKKKRKHFRKVMKALLFAMENYLSD